MEADRVREEGREMLKRWTQNWYFISQALKRCFLYTTKLCMCSVSVCVCVTLKLKIKARGSKDSKNEWF